MSKFDELQRRITASLNETVSAGTEHSSRVMAGMESLKTLSDNRLETINISQITPNPHQPRIEFKEEELEHLANSIQELGLLQPIIVRKAGLNRYQIVAGERRYRACERIGKTKIDCVVVNITDEENALLALAENITREGLADYEIAKGIITFHRDYPNKKEYAELLNIGRPKLYRLLSFEALPVSVLNRLDVKPGLISDYSAQQIKKLTNDGYAMSILEPYIHQALDLFEKGEIKQSKISTYIENCVKQDSTKNVSRINTKKRELVRADGSSYGKIKEDGKNFTVQIKLDEISENNKKKLEEFLQNIMEN